MTQSMLAAISGFALGASLIIAIGSQNAFILRMGLLRAHVFILCLICALADALLILLGISGMGALVNANPQLLRFVALGGAAFLFAYALLSARRAFRSEQLLADQSVKSPPALGPAIAHCLAFTFLNPHVYLDTVVLVGAYSAAYEGAARLAFATGAVCASFCWFYALGYGARLLTPFFAKPIAWRILDSFIAVVMTALGAALLRQALA